MNMHHESAPAITTRGELREAGWQSQSVRDELRSNLITALSRGEGLFAGIHGYEQTVIPQLENAILAGHDIILLGERGQAKTRLARSLVQLLDPWMPVISGSETHDDPFQPISSFGKTMVSHHGDATPISWIPRDQRFAEKLATPDATIADFIGEVDPIKVAEGRYLSNEEILSFGLIPRTNRGIFNLNELPDLAERIQVGLLNILEERDVQIRGFQVRLPVDVLVVASANPEDYTNRGRIITPLKDRFGSQIRTHYPRTIEQELRIVDQEHGVRPIDDLRTDMPWFMRELVAQISHIARSSREVSQRSGVSVRMSIAVYESLMANAQRRALSLREPVAVPRITDLHAIEPAVMGKIELETFGDGEDGDVIDGLIGQAVTRVAGELLELDAVRALRAAIEASDSLLVSDMTPRSDYIDIVSRYPGLRADLEGWARDDRDDVLPSALEFALEALFRVRAISRHDVESGVRYGLPTS